MENFGSSVLIGLFASRKSQKPRPSEAWTGQSGDDNLGTDGTFPNLPDKEFWDTPVCPGFCRRGLYDDCNSRPEGEPALVYFGGLHDGTLLGMGGSSCHVVGHEGATSTWSRSSTPALTRWLLSGLHNGERPKPYIPFGNYPQEEEDEVYAAMALALHYLRPPTQQVEFVAKTIAVGEIRGVGSYIGVDSVRAVLATPIYVAQGELFNDNQVWGLSEKDWLLDNGRKPRTTKISRLDGHGQQKKAASEGRG